LSYTRGEQRLAVEIVDADDMASEVRTELPRRAVRL